MARRTWNTGDPATPLSAARLTGMEDDIEAGLLVDDANLATRLGNAAGLARGVLNGIYATQSALTAVSSSILGYGKSAALANTIMGRDGNGRSQVAYPVASADIATKGYVDSTVAPLAWPTVMGTQIGFIGDSYSSGYGLANPTTERWPRLLANYAGAAEQNLAVPSSGYINQGSGGASKFANQAALLSGACTHVIICGGINDAPLGASASAIQAEVTATIAAVRTAAPAARITVISPMWMASAPSADLLTVEANIRPAIPADVTFIEGAMWLRIDRTEWQQADGHPNSTGAIAIANWVRDQFGGSKSGAEFLQSVYPGTADKALNTTNFPGYVITSDTVKGARSGWWELDGQAVFYGVANGFIHLTETARKVSLRHDTTSNPSVLRHRMRFYHPGGDLIVKLGYDPSAGATTLITNGQTKLTARRVGVSNP